SVHGNRKGDEGDRSRPRHDFGEVPGHRKAKGSGSSRFGCARALFSQWSSGHARRRRQLLRPEIQPESQRAAEGRSGGVLASALACNYPQRRKRHTIVCRFFYAIGCYWISPPFWSSSAAGITT